MWMIHFAPQESFIDEQLPNSRFMICNLRWRMVFPALLEFILPEKWRTVLSGWHDLVFVSKSLMLLKHTLKEYLLHFLWHPCMSCYVDADFAGFWPHEDKQYPSCVKQNSFHKSVSPIVN